ncbi:MAG TPA: tetratricopeptide repeat protein [Phycisphaerae bacterium]
MLAVGAAACVAHWSVLDSKALSVDDGEYLTDNPLVQHPSWESAGRFLREVRAPSTVKGYYQPLSMISLMLDYALAGSTGNLRPFHRTSLMLHVLNTILATLLLYQLFGNPWAAAIPGLLFGVHPLAVEPMAWIADRKTLLATFFALLSLVLYVRYARHTSAAPLAPPNRQRSIIYLGCLFTYILSLMSKPTTTLLPVLLVLLDIWPLRRFSRRTLLEKLPFVVLTVISIPITIVSQSTTWGVARPEQTPALRVPLIIAHNIVFYLYKVFIPLDMSAHYPPPQPLDLSHPMVLAGVVGSGLLLAGLWLSLRWTRALLIGWLFFFVAVLPTMGVISFTNVVAADKFAYLPALGFMLPLAAGLAHVWKRPVRSAVRPAVLSAACALAIVLAVDTRRCLAHWENSEALFRYMVRRAPNASVPRAGLGNALRELGRMDEAIMAYREAVRLEPRYIVARLNLANGLAQQNNPDAAIAHYRVILESDPAHLEALNNIANALAAEDRVDEALTFYRRYLALRPDSPAVQHNLGLAVARQREIEAFIKQCEQSQQIKPDDAAAHFRLGQAYFAQGQIPEAIMLYRRAVSLSPALADYRKHLGLALMKRGIREEALRHLSEAANLTGDDADVRIALGALLAQSGRPLEAAEQYRQALRLKPELITVANNLAWLLATCDGASQHDIAEAVSLADRIRNQSDGKHPELLDTLAASYAAAGRFPEAVQTARQAIELASASGQKDLADQIRGRLRLYEAHRPYRE